RRVTTDTITSDVNADMQLSPVLELELPYSAANPSRGLPILSGVDVSTIGQTTPTTDWLDRNALLPYAITVGEVNPDDGSLYAYLPLGVVEDRNGGSPVALTGIMHYKMPAAASGWGGDHQVRLLWLVNGLSDSCDAPEELSTEEATAYCEDDANWISQKTLLQSYYDDFSVTGLQVEESHGSSAAVFAQKNNSGAYDPQLWHLADVLQTTFLTHSIDPSTGQRLTVGNIDQHLAAWGVSNLYVNEVLNAVDEPTLMSDLTGDNVSTMLIAARPSAAIGDYAQLLYAVELRGRTARLGELAATFENNAFHLDLTNADLATEGLLRWKPYRYTVGGWQDTAIASNADTDTFISALETALDSTFTTARLDTILDAPPADYDRVRQGAKMLAVNYYMSPYVGLASTLESSGLTAGERFVDSNYQMPDDPATAIVGRLAGIIQDYYAQVSLSNLAIATSDAEIEGVANSTWASLASSATAILTGMGDLVAGEKSSLAIALQALDAIGVPEGAAGLAEEGALAMSKSVVHVLEVGVASVKLAHVIFHASESIPRAWKYYNAVQDARYTVNSLQISANYAKAQDWTSLPGGPHSSDYRALQNALDNTAAELEPKYLKAAKVGLAVELATIAFEFALTLAIEKIPLDSTEFNQLVAHTIASVVVAVVQFAIIVSNPGFAILFVFVHILDALLSLVCTITGDGKKEVTYDANGIATYVACHGIAGTVTEGLTYLINDTTLLMDLENENQFEPFFGISNITVADEAGGFAVGNTLTLNAIITATAYTGKPNWMGYIYNWQLRDENVKETAVDFRLQTSEADFDKDLSFGDTAWERPAGFDPDKDIRRDDLGTPTNPQPGKRYEATFQPTVDHTLSQAGVNVGLSGVYFSQA
ncbi:MAG: hypothetical protein KDE31_11990, partial [Caldilineaceae bacterium]|nr:hypothetical protein [Caldilineaceae bacterium]